MDARRDRRDLNGVLLSFTGRVSWTTLCSQSSHTHTQTKTINNQRKVGLKTKEDVMLHFVDVLARPLKGPHVSYLVFPLPDADVSAGVWRSGHAVQLRQQRGQLVVGGLKEVQLQGQLQATTTAVRVLPVLRPPRCPLPRPAAAPFPPGSFGWKRTRFRRTSSSASPLLP